MKLSGHRIAYTLLLWLLLPYALLHLLWRARRQPEYLRHVGERFGRYRMRSARPVIWLHVVSVGETRAAQTLVQALQERYPDHSLLLTHTTPTGRATSEQLYGDSVLRAYLPYDYPFAVERFLRHFQPRVGVLLETEIWFNLIHACQKERIPLLLLNARLSEKSARGYAHFAPLVRQALHELTAIAAQTEADARRLRQLGAQKVSVMGNLKFDIVPPTEMVARGLALRAALGRDRPVFLAASTREGEETLILEALSRVHVADLLAVIVPRHPQRFAEVGQLIAGQGWRWQARSAGQAVAKETQVLLGDSMGEMFAYYTACDLAFIGGSLLPYGGQNLIEAAACGKPVLVGPHTFNFAQASEQALAAGAALRISDAAELAEKIDLLFQQPERRAAMGAAGLRFVQANAGATQRALACLAGPLSAMRD